MKTANDCICAWINLYSYEKDRRIALETALKNLQREKDIMQRNYETNRKFVQIFGKAQTSNIS